MSDFTSRFLELVRHRRSRSASIGSCAWLLLVDEPDQGQAAPPAPGKAVDTTGHVWDDDLAEYNNPLPRWWMWLFWITIVFALVYLVLYPGLGSVPGRARLDVGRRSTRRRARRSTRRSSRSTTSTWRWTCKQVAADPQARAMGERLFLNNCAQCHGSDAGGSRGFPNLRDDDWLYGGDAGDDQRIDHRTAASA